jgi:hypothetical protein
VPGDHPGRGEFGSLLGRTALAIDSSRGDLLGPARREDGTAAHVVRLLTDLADAAPDDVVDPTRVDAGALDERAQHMGR